MWPIARTRVGPAMLCPEDAVALSRGACAPPCYPAGVSRLERKSVCISLQGRRRGGAHSAGGRSGAQGRTAAGTWGLCYRAHLPAPRSGALKAPLSANLMARACGRAALPHSAPCPCAPLTPVACMSLPSGCSAGALPVLGLCSAVPPPCPMHELSGYSPSYSITT